MRDITDHAFPVTTATCLYNTRMGLIFLMRSWKIIHDWVSKENQPQSDQSDDVEPTIAKSPAD